MNEGNQERESILYDTIYKKKYWKYKAIYVIESWSVVP